MFDLSAAAPFLNPEVADRAETALVCAAENRKIPSRFLVLDMSQPSTAQRLVEFDLTNPDRPHVILKSQVAHGSGSDDHGRAVRFSNKPNSNETSLGLYQIGGRYANEVHPAYVLQGLDPGWNDQAESRHVVLHPASYVSPNWTGTSQGCTAVSTDTFAKFDKDPRFSGALLWVDGGDPGLDSAPSLSCEAARFSKAWNTSPPDLGLVNLADSEMALRSAWRTL